MALTRKKEPLYWGDIVEGQTKPGDDDLAINGQQFIDVISAPELQLGSNEDYLIDNVKKQNHLFKRF